jgi:hypothetical protein
MTRVEGLIRSEGPGAEGMGLVELQHLIDEEEGRAMGDDRGGRGEHGGGALWLNRLLAYGKRGVGARSEEWGVGMERKTENEERKGIGAGWGLRA